MSGELVTSIANRAVLSSRKRGTVKRRTQRSRHSDASESFYLKSVIQVGGEPTSWTNFANAIGSQDGSESQATIPAVSSTKRLTNDPEIPFVAPASAKLTGFTARIRARGDAPAILIHVQIHSGTDTPVAVGSEKQLITSPSAKDLVYGGRTDLWGTGWSISDLRTLKARVVARAVNESLGELDAFIDSIQFTAHYG